MPREGNTMSKEQGDGSSTRELPLLYDRHTRREESLTHNDGEGEVVGIVELKGCRGRVGEMVEWRRLSVSDVQKDRVVGEVWGGGGVKVVMVGLVLLREERLSVPDFVVEEEEGSVQLSEH